MGKHCVVVVLNASERLDDLLRAWHDAGASGAILFTVPVDVVIGLYHPAQA